MKSIKNNKKPWKPSSNTINNKKADNIQNFQVIERINPEPINSLFTINKENKPIIKLESIIKICKHYEKKCSGNYDKNSISGRCLFQLSREIQSIIEELIIKFDYQKDRIEKLQNIVLEWDKYFGPHSTENLKAKYNNLPITPSILKQYINELENKIYLFEQDRINRLEHEENEIMEIENAIDIHNQVARDQYHVEMKRLEMEKQRYVDKIKKEYDEKLKDIQNKYDNEIKKLNNKNEENLNSLSVIHDEEENKLRNQLDKLNNDILKEKEENNKKSHEISFLNNSISNYNKELSELHTEIDTIRNDFQDIIENKDKEYNNTIYNLQNDFSKKENNLYKSIRKLEEDNRLLEYNNHSLKQILTQIQLQFANGLRYENDISGINISVELPETKITNKFMKKFENQTIKNKKNIMKFSPQYLTGNIQVSYD